MSFNLEGKKISEQTIYVDPKHLQVVRITCVVPCSFSILAMWQTTGWPINTVTHFVLFYFIMFVISVTDIIHLCSLVFSLYITAIFTVLGTLLFRKNGPWRIAPHGRCPLQAGVDYSENRRCSNGIVFKCISSSNSFRRQNLKDQQRSGRPRTVRTRELKLPGSEKIKINPPRNIRKLAREHRDSNSTMQLLIREDLKLTVRNPLKGKMLTDGMKASRLEKCCWMKQLEPR